MLLARLADDLESFLYLRLLIDDCEIAAKLTPAFPEETSLLFADNSGLK